MLAYALRRLVLAIPLILGITLISFMVIHLAPGEPGQTPGEMVTAEAKRAYEQLKVEYHLDRPLPEQYWIWLKRLARLDLGRSFAPHGRSPCC
jgi:peptide/nickel transport system permease protein